MYQVDYQIVSISLLKPEEHNELNRITQLFTDTLLPLITHLNDRVKNNKQGSLNHQVGDLFCALPILYYQKKKEMLSIKYAPSSFSVNRSEKEMNKVCSCVQAHQGFSNKLYIDYNFIKTVLSL